VLPPLRAHADLIDPIAFAEFLRGPALGLRFDVLLEAKAKDLALLRLREQLTARGFAWGSGRVQSAASASTPASAPSPSPKKSHSSTRLPSGSER
jgi:hypothetical protein